MRDRKKYVMVLAKKIVFLKHLTFWISEMDHAAFLILLMQKLK